MRKYRLKELKEYAVRGFAQDVTYYDNDKYHALLEKESQLEQIGYSTGIYGKNGALYQGRDTGSYYVITSRSAALFIFD